MPRANEEVPTQFTVTLRLHEDGTISIQSDLDESSDPVRWIVREAADYLDREAREVRHDKNLRARWEREAD